MTRLASILRTLSMAGTILLGCLLCVAAGLGEADLGRRPPWSMGNGPAVTEAISKRADRDSLRLAVLGDGQTTTTFRHLLAAVGRQAPDFVVLVGDAVRSPSLGFHRWLSFQVARAIGDTPVLYLPGNRDLGTGPGQVDRDAFVHRYGSDCFSFVAAGTLFVGLGISEPWQDGPGQLDFLETELARPRPEVERRIVFSHFAPQVGRGQAGYGLDPGSSTRLLALCRTHRVDYVIAGHYHGYARAEIDGTRILITGGAGGHLHGCDTGRLHHALILDLAPGRSEELLVTIDPVIDFDASIGGNLLGRVHPWLAATGLLPQP